MVPGGKGEESSVALELDTLGEMWRSGSSGAVTNDIVRNLVNVIRHGDVGDAGRVGVVDRPPSVEILRVSWAEAGLTPSTDSFEVLRELAVQMGSESSTVDARLPLFLEEVRAAVSSTVEVLRALFLEDVRAPNSSSGSGVWTMEMRLWGREDSTASSSIDISPLRSSSSAIQSRVVLPT